MKEYKEYLKVGDEIMFRKGSVLLINNKNLSSTKKYKVTYAKHFFKSYEYVSIMVEGVGLAGSGIFLNPIVFSDGVKMENTNSTIILVENRSIQEELEI